MSAAAFAYVRDAVLQTIGITCVSFLVALLAGLPLGILIAREDRLARGLSAFVAVVRAIPELVLAIVAVVAVGLGPLAGIVALGAHYAAVVAKLTAELLHSVRREPAEALRATGATSAAAYLVALVPPAWPGLVGFGAYAFESIVRAAVIVGVVGAGGLGSDLIQALNLADYRTFSLLLLALVGLVVGVDALSTRLRAGVSPRAIVPAFAAIVAVAAVSLMYGDAFQWNVVAGAPAHLAAFAAGALPPDLSGGVLVRAANGVLVSIGVALAGTALGVLLAMPFALASATPVARGWMRGTGWRPWSWLPEIPARGTLAVARATPPIALGLIGLTFVGLGPKAGIFALAIHTAGVLGKLLAESLEVAERGPAIALAATGATAASAIGVALIPSALPAMLTHALYRFEWNVRASTVLGMIGAGGLGQAIFESQQLMFYRPLLTYVLVAIVLVLAVDTLGARARTVLRLSTLTR
ncbi:phosphonate ABC transporter, permease protein PhnE [Vulcanimicrobium alpinum]|uniref:Phosphonate ABC transporter, permease protein PhnE n=1 Tax=Vulcanimicrobium alpinum TaxID=3016050 RepID=A0AAN1XZA1_UNVUL|nr:ABC transporter permease subunit [Vulcanimicrobium alpinum]BDE08104.1 phosphonate ABC transporter, permease protein PhnE [Vulcanimicrobium alpinum]